MPWPRSSAAKTSVMTRRELQPKIRFRSSIVPGCGFILAWRHQVRIQFGRFLEFSASFIFFTFLCERDCELIVSHRVGRHGVDGSAELRDGSIQIAIGKQPLSGIRSEGRSLQTGLLVTNL